MSLKSALIEFANQPTALNRGVTFSILGSVAAAGLGAVNAVLVASTFSNVVQGFFYAFGAMATLYVFLELGLGQTVIQFASHEWGRVRSDSETDRCRGVMRLASLRRICVVWYAACGMLILIAIAPLGYVFFAERAATGVKWIGPWLVLCAGVAANVLLTPVFLDVQVRREPAEFWFYRLVYQILYGVALAGAISLGTELWASGIATWIGLVWSMAWAARHATMMNTLRVTSPSAWRLWYYELWPLQWRVGLTWLSSHVTTPLLIVTVFYCGGPVLAGQVGMSSTATILLVTVASSWIVTQAPRFGFLIATDRHAELEEFFVSALRVVMSVAVIGGLALWVVVYVLNSIEHPLAERFVGPTPMALFVAVGILQAAVIGVSSYIRAHKEEPLGKVSVWALAVTVSGAVTLTSSWGAVGIAVAQLAAVGALQLPAALWCLTRLRDGHRPVLTREAWVRD